MEEIAKKDHVKNGRLSYPISKRNITDRKSRSNQLISESEEAFVTAKCDITKSIDDYTLTIETVICETHNSLIVTSELPKLYKDDLEIEITSRRIILRGEFHQQVEIKQGQRKKNHLNELNKNIFLPKTINPGKAEAEFNNDILLIKLPKAEIEKVQKFCNKSK
ncbi:MAG: Hsp20/alpha crystallin family protein [Methanobacterium sp.]